MNKNYINITSTDLAFSESIRVIIIKNEMSSLILDFLIDLFIISVLFWWGYYFLHALNRQCQMPILLFAQSKDPSVAQQR